MTRLLRLAQVKTHAALDRHLDQIAEAKLVARVLAYAEDDDLAVETPICKQLLNAFHLIHNHLAPHQAATYSNRINYLHQSSLIFASEDGFTFTATTIADVKGSWLEHSYTQMK